MTDNLKNLRKELKSFAKRVKDFKYTDSALITFLLTGMIGITGFTTNLYSAEDEIKEQEHAINTSILQLQKDFRRARQENNKLLRATNLELIQLMEQGDHVTKSPWSSWQYGANSFYNDWQGRYKGRGDKVKDVKYTRSTGMDKYQYKRRGQLTYGGSTEITFPIEPNAAIPITAALKPIQPLAKNANLALKVNLSGLPAFEPTTVMPPVTPSIDAPDPRISPNITINSGSRGSGNDTYVFATNGEATFQNVAVVGDNIKVSSTNNSTALRTQSYQTTNVKAIKLPVSASTPSSAAAGFSYGNLMTNTSYTTTNTNAFFQINSGITLNGANIQYESTGTDPKRLSELVHQDVHDGQTSTTIANAITDSGITKFNTSDFNEIYKISAYGGTTATLPSTHYNVFANAGNVEINGKNNSIFKQL